MGWDWLARELQSDIVSGSRGLYVTRRHFLAITVVVVASSCLVACRESGEDTAAGKAVRPTGTRAWVETAAVVRSESTTSSVPDATALPGPTMRGSGTTPRLSPTVERVPVKLTILYDNNAGQRGLVADWGFSCLVEMPDDWVLFDTGADGEILSKNADVLSVDLCAVDRVVLSHAHGDHTGGLMSVLECVARPPVYVLQSFPSSLKHQVMARTRLVDVVAHAEIIAGVHTTGEVGRGISEQALVVESGSGTIVLTGCAHPGVVEMVRKAKEIDSGDIALLMGGFHLGSSSREQISVILSQLKALGVKRIAPCHCSGELARAMSREVFGEDCLLVGVGDVVQV